MKKYKIIKLPKIARYKNYKYNIQIWLNGCYCGNGIYCTNLLQTFIFILKDILKNKITTSKQY